MRPTRARWPTSSKRWPGTSSACRATATEPSGSNAQRTVHGLLAELRLADIDALSRQSRLGDRPGLKTLLGGVAEELARLTTGIARTYFSHADDGQSVLAAALGSR